MADREHSNGPLALIRRIAIGTGLSATVLLLILTAFLLFIQTETGKEWLRVKLSALLSSHPDRTVELGRIEGTLPWRLHLESLTLGDSDGAWLVAHSLALRWSPGNLLRGEVRIEELSVASVEMKRTPRAAEGEPSGQAGMPDVTFEPPPLTIDSLFIPSVTVGEAVFGHAATLEILGFIQPSDKATDRTLFLQMGRIDGGPELGVHLTAQLRKESSSLMLDMEAFEAAGGMLSQMMDLKDAGDLQLRLAGDGPSSGWEGSLEGRADRWGAVMSSLSMSLHELKSAEWFAILIPASPGPSEDGRTGFPSETTLHLKILLPEDQVIQLDHLDAWGTGLSLESSGRFDLRSDSLAAQLSLTSSDLGDLASVFSIPLQGRGELCGRFSGSFGSPQADLSLNLQDIHAPQFRAAAIFTQLQAEPSPVAANQETADWRIAGIGRAAGLQDAAGRKLPEESLDWSLKAETASGGEEISLETLRVNGAAHRLNAQGRFIPASLDGKFHVDLQVTDLRTLTALMGRETPGSLTLNAQAAGSGSTRSAAGSLRGVLSLAGKKSDALVALMGPETTVTTDFELREGNALEIFNGLIRSPAFEINAGGSFNIPNSSVKGELMASMADLSALSPLLNEDLSGSVKTSLSVEGPLDDLKVTHWLEGSQVRWRQQQPSEIQSSLEATHAPWNARGQWKLLVNQAREKLEASTGFELSKERLRIAGLRFDGPGARLNGDLVVNLEAATAEGTLQGRFEDLERLGRFIGEPLGGSALLDARLESPRQSQNAALKVNGKHLSTRLGKLSSLDITADLKDLKRALQGTLQAEVSGLEAGTTLVRSAVFKAEGDRSRLAFSGRAQGRVLQETQLQLAGSLAQSNNALRLEVADFKGRFGPYPFGLNGRTLFQHSPEAASLDRLSLSFGPGNLAAGGSLSKGRVQGHVRFEGVPLELISLLGGPGMSGAAEGKLEIDGLPSQPNAAVELQLAEFRIRAIEGQKLPPALLNAKARLGGGRVRGDLALEQVLEKPARVEFAIPMQVSLSPVFNVELLREAPLQAHAELEGELRRVAGFLPLADQTISGLAQASLDVSGSLSKPDFSGDIRITKGFYENLNSGTILKELNAEITARDQRLEVTRFQATDAEKGQISLKGWLELDAARQFPLELEAAFNDATLIRRPDIDATTDGQVKVSGTATAMQLGGSITVAPAEYRIPDRLPAGAVDLEVIEILSSGKKVVPDSAETPSSKPVPLALNLALTLPNRTFVRGRGLDSEWRGQLAIGGTAAQPTVKGQLNVVRGNFDFLDRRFDLRRGTITFFGATPPVPLLDFTAEAQTKDITARVLVTGSASSPEIQLQSDPPLPQEEVLSRVLFGRSLDKISPVQALRLAQALRSLSGGTGLPGLDFLGATRRLLGLDDLELRSTAGSSETGLGFGKYLTEDIYVDVEKDLRGSGGKISVEVELTPNITVESQLGSDAETGIGINWKYDY